MKKTILSFILILSINFVIFNNIKDVVVFKDRALVTRLEKSESNTGINEITFKSIPLNVYPESIRAKGNVTKGSGLKILDIKLIKNYEKNITKDEWEKLESEIEEYKETLNKLTAKKTRITKEKELLNIFNEKSGNQTNEDLETGKFSMKQWEEAFKYYQYQTEYLDNEWFKTDKEIKMIKEKITVLEDQYNKYKNKKTFYTLDAVVSYQLKNEGTVEILLSYIVQGTYWYPIYDCRLDMESKELVLEYYAKVYQNTGEDWDNVKLILSTARPDLSGKIPEIYPWELDFYYDYEKKKDYSKSYMRSEKEKAEIDDKLSEEYGYEDKDEEEGYQAEIDSKGLALNYNILQKATLPTGKEEIKVTISTGIKLNPELSWAIIPRLNESAFLTGNIKNESDFTFLPGEISIFVDDSFIGKSSIDMINPTQEFQLSLGRDPRITADFKLEDIEKGKKLGKKYEKRKYVITISNNANEDVTINIKDTIPKTLQPKKITIKIISIDPEPNEIENESICKWDLTIRKNDKLKIMEEWYVEYPEENNVRGL